MPPPALGVVRELEHVAHPLRERCRHLIGHAQDVPDHPHRNLLRILGGGIALATGEHVVDQPPAQIASEDLVLGHPRRAHRGQHEAPGPGVQWRVGADGRHAGGEQWRPALLAHVDERDDADAVARWEVLDVVRDGVHIGVARGQPRAAPAVGVCHRAGLTQLVPDAERVGDVLRVEDVVVARPIGDRGGDGCVVGGVAAHRCRTPRRIIDDHPGRGQRWHHQRGVNLVGARASQPSTADRGESGASGCRRRCPRR